MPQVSKVSGIFSSCLSVGKHRSKPGNNSFDFGRIHKCKNQKVLCTTFEPQILAGIGQFIWVGKQRWVQHQREITQDFLLFASLNFARARIQNVNLFCFCSFDYKHWFQFCICFTLILQKSDGQVSAQRQKSQLQTDRHHHPFFPSTTRAGHMWWGKNEWQPHTSRLHNFITESWLCSGGTTVRQQPVSTSHLSILALLIKLSVKGGN